MTKTTTSSDAALSLGAKDCHSKVQHGNAPSPGDAQTTQTRDQVTGQYAFDGNFDRICTCGHRLGAHIAGGFECGTNTTDHPETKDCKCERFRPCRKKQ
jgi:hypothetical protein